MLGTGPREDSGLSASCSRPLLQCFVCILLPNRSTAVVTSSQGVILPTCRERLTLRLVHLLVQCQEHPVSRFPGQARQPMLHNRCQLRSLICASLLFGPREPSARPLPQPGWGPGSHAPSRAQREPRLVAPPGEGGKRPALSPLHRFAGALIATLLLQSDLDGLGGALVRGQGL